MADRYVLVPATSPISSECYHLPSEGHETRPYCTPSATYERVSLRTARANDLRRCRRCAQKHGTDREATTDTTCPFCTERVVKTRLPHHLQTCPQTSQ